MHSWCPLSLRSLSTPAAIIMSFELGGRFFILETICYFYDSKSLAFNGITPLKTVVVGELNQKSPKRDLISLSLIKKLIFQSINLKGCKKLYRFPA